MPSSESTSFPTRSLCAISTSSVDRDSDPVWSPDGTQVAFIRQPATRCARCSSGRAGQPSPGRFDVRRCRRRAGREAGGAPRKARAARSMRWWPKISCFGARATASSVPRGAGDRLPASVLGLDAEAAPPSPPECERPRSKLSTSRFRATPRLCCSPRTRAISTAVISLARFRFRRRTDAMITRGEGLEWSPLEDRGRQGRGDAAFRSQKSPRVAAIKVEGRDDAAT